jgi:type IV pilus assembly protein PilA
MLTALNQRLSRAGRVTAREESGFTLIELLVVLVIIGVLLAIAVPSYLGFKKRAENSTAKSNVRAAIPAMEAFYSDNGSYASADLAALRSIDSGIASVTLSGLAPAAYTIAFTQGQCTATVTGPGGVISSNC